MTEYGWLDGSEGSVGSEKHEQRIVNFVGFFSWYVLAQLETNLNRIRKPKRWGLFEFKNDECGRKVQKKQKKRGRKREREQRETKAAVDGNPICPSITAMELRTMG